MIRIRVAVVGAVFGLAIVGCAGSNDSDSETATSSPTSSAAVTSKPATTTVAPAPLAETTTVAPAPPIVTTTTAVPTPEAAAPALMPNVMCMNLQDAQDLIQEAGVFLSRSFDATGDGRNQIVDSNWVVVSQNIPPGTPFGEGEAKLGVVKYGESGAC